MEAPRATPWSFVQEQCNHWDVTNLFPPLKPTLVTHNLFPTIKTYLFYDWVGSLIIAMLHQLHHWVRHEPRKRVFSIFSNFSTVTSTLLDLEIKVAIILWNSLVYALHIRLIYSGHTAYRKAMIPQKISHLDHTAHITYSWNIMCKKWEGDCGLWVLHEMIKKIYTESLKKIVGAVWELPAK